MSMTSTNAPEDVASSESMSRTGVAGMLPLLLEDHVQARQDGLGVLGSPRILAGRG